MAAWLSNVARIAFLPFPSGIAVAPPAIATTFPDPFAGTAAIKGTDPLAASVIARVDPFAASVANKGS